MVDNSIRVLAYEAAEDYSYEIFLERTADALARMCEDHSRSSVRNMEDLVWELRPGCGEDVVPLVRDALLKLPVDPRAAAVALRVIWTDGKVGSNIIPDPQELSLNRYIKARDEELEPLRQISDPVDVMNQEDAEFWRSLPDPVKVYRGVANVDLEKAKAGPCWTTDYELGKWFAMRASGFTGGEPILLSATVSKTDIITVTRARSEDEVVLPGVDHARRIPVGQVA